MAGFKQGVRDGTMAAVLALVATFDAWVIRLILDVGVTDSLIVGFGIVILAQLVTSERRA